MASERDTTGNLRSWHAHKGITRNLREPDVSMLNSRTDTGGNKVHGVGNALSNTDERNQRASMVSQRHLKRSAARRASGSLSR